jgi:hypothetical protein
LNRLRSRVYLLGSQAVQTVQRLRSVQAVLGNYVRDQLARTGVATCTWLSIKEAIRSISVQLYDDFQPHSSFVRDIIARACSHRCPHAQDYGQESKKVKRKKKGQEKSFRDKLKIQGSASTSRYPTGEWYTDARFIALAQFLGSPTPLLAMGLFRPLTEAVELPNAVEFFLGSDHQQMPNRSVQLLACRETESNNHRSS